MTNQTATVSEVRAREDRAYRRERRKVRAAAGEIKELNIIAMMDIMTIILVFLLKSYSTSSLNISQSEKLQIPVSNSAAKAQENINIQISRTEIVVNDRPIVRMEGDLIPKQYKAGKADNFYVSSIYEALKKEVDKQKYIARYNAKAPFHGRVNIIADKRIPYRTLMEVLYTAGQAELGEYKFMIMKHE